MTNAKHDWQEVALNENSDVWDKSEPLEGRFVGAQEDVGLNKSKLYTIKKDNGEEVKVWGSTVLDDKLMGIPQGTYVKLEFEGKKTSKSGTQYNSYKVFIDLNSKSDDPHPADRLTEEDLPPEFQ